MATPPSGPKPPGRSADLCEEANHGTAFASGIITHIGNYNHNATAAVLLHKPQRAVAFCQMDRFTITTIAIFTRAPGHA